MTERVACTGCGAPILTSTAQRTDGLCMPCKGGYRQDLEESRKRNAELRELAETEKERPQHKLWISILDRVYHTPEGMHALTPDEQTYFAVLSLEHEVYNGGLEQYFTNSAADHYAYALRGLKELGQLRARRCLIDAKEVLLGLGPVPGRRGRCRKIFPRTDREHSGLNKYLSELDQQFRSHAASIVERMERFSIERLLPDETGAR